MDWLSVIRELLQHTVPKLGDVIINLDRFIITLGVVRINLGNVVLELGV